MNARYVLKSLYSRVRRELAATRGEFASAYPAYSQVFVDSRTELVAKIDSLHYLDEGMASRIGLATRDAELLSIPVDRSF